MVDNTIQQPTRRQVLQTGSVVAGAAVAGCLGGSDDDTLGYISRGGITQDAERELFEEWSADSGIDVTHQEVADDAEMVELIAANPNDFDFANLVSWAYELNRLEHDEGLFAEIDVDRVPNYDNVDDAWQSAPLVDDNPYGIFYYISTQGLIYNTEHGDISSWEDMKDEEYDGELTLQDSAVSRFGNSCASLGYDIAEAANDDDLYEDAVAEMEDQHENVFTYWTAGDEFMRLLREEQAAVSEGWGGRAENLQEDGYPVEYVIPEEGCITWSTAFSIVEESDMKEEVYDLLDFIYERENAVELAQTHKYPVPLEDPPEEITERAEYTEDPDDLVWIDWSDIVPLQEELEQRHNEIQS
ncbi:extracellular solute-binding protein [Natronorubrum sediminis]|uniref:Extracellular solute-binding protein n=1 Tax=Natronorubrum sediminis TaxID=640943 RepID=A0A1H6G3S3_9EURY|nr:extracellular solute-binding protein [Natronorubrum sediminis]SEH17242.1 extracellular solute-binding protein [Natronorubrum sediminis]